MSFGYENEYINIQLLLNNILESRKSSHMYKLLSHEHNTFAIDDNTFLPNVTELKIFKLSVSRVISNTTRRTKNAKHIQNP